MDVKLAPGLRIGYVMGTGDLVPDAIEGLGVAPQLLSTAELGSGRSLRLQRDRDRHSRLFRSPRAGPPAAAPRRICAQGRDARSSSTRAARSLPRCRSPCGRFAERVVDEQAPVKLLDPSNPLLTSPNKITSADFDGWVEERGHSFLESWDPGYTPLTETADPGQDPQRGGLIVAHPGKGTYIYVAYALYRQLPELVPGAYRLLANLLSAGRTSTPAPPAK